MLNLPYSVPNSGIGIKIDHNRTPHNELNEGDIFNNDLINEGIETKSDLDKSRGGKNTSKVNISIPLSKEDMRADKPKQQSKVAKLRNVVLSSKLKLGKLVHNLSFV